jgi:MULE transposase domain/SWIM zinc finger
MFGKHPTTIITDQDPTMKVAIQKVFPNTVHRCCQWHVMRKAREKLLKLYESRLGFEQQLGTVINHSLTVSDFEKAWRDMVNMHKVHDNNHLKVMFDKRTEWVPAYFRDIFFAEMSTTQRSESMNAVLKLWLDNHTSIFRFVQKVENMIDEIWHKESDEDIKTMNETPRLWSKAQIEQEARQIYTRVNFSIFKDILNESTLGIVVEIERDTLYEVRIKSNPFVTNRVPRSYMVEVDICNERFSCNCKGFQFEGFLCQHAIKVLHYVGFEYLPKHYILKRWCKDANVNAKRSIEEASTNLGESEETQQTFMKATLQHDFGELKELALAIPAIFTIVRSKISEIMEEIRPMLANNLSKEVLLAPMEVEYEHDKGERTLDPPFSQCKGRKKKTSTHEAYHRDKGKAEKNLQLLSHERVP